MKPSDYSRVEKAIRYLGERFPEKPSLEKTARAVGLSPFHFQRLFKRWAGVSPKQFIQFLSAQNAKQKLSESRNLLDATFEADLSSPGRLHDLLVSVEAMTPGEYKNRGRDLVIEYGTYSSSFGECLLALTDRGLCGLSFLDARGLKPALADLQKRWPASTFRKNQNHARKTGKLLFSRKAPKGAGLNLVLKGTHFQLKVWEALLRIPEKALVSYGGLARAVGKPKASRAVGTAVGQNPIAYLIPCHRVIRETGVLGNYRWGADRKKAMLGWESARGQEKS